MVVGARVFLKWFGARLSFKRFGLKVVLWSLGLLVLRFPGPLVSWSRASPVPRFSNSLLRFCFGPLVSLASWSSRSLVARPHDPSSFGIVLWSPDALVPGPLHTSCRSSLVFWSSCPLVLSFLGPLVMMRRNFNLVSMGFVLVVRVFCCFLNMIGFRQMKGHV